MQAAAFKQSTLRQYRSIVDRFILPNVGEVQLLDLDRDVLCDFRGGLVEKATADQRWRVLRILRAILFDADRRGSAAPDCLRHLAYPRPRSKKRREAPSWADVRQMIVASEASTSTSSLRQFRSALKVLLETGMRPLEACRLTWGCFDLERCEITVRTSERWHSSRKVPITGRSSRELNQLAISYRADASALAFPALYRGEASSNSLSRAFRQLQLVAGLTTAGADKDERGSSLVKYTLYDLRLVAPDWWCCAGLSHEHVRELLGLRPLDRWSEVPAHLARRSVKPEITAGLERQLYGEGVVQ
jgi:integrase